MVSLFSGVGGMDLGFQGGFDFLGTHYAEQPYNLIFSNDIFKQAAEVYEVNFGHKVERRSINDIDVKELPNEEVDIVLGDFLVKLLVIQGKEED